MKAIIEKLDGSLRKILETFHRRADFPPFRPASRVSLDKKDKEKKPNRKVERERKREREREREIDREREKEKER